MRESGLLSLVVSSRNMAMTITTTTKHDNNCKNIISHNNEPFWAKY